MTFGENLKKLREDFPLSQENLANKLKVDQKTISNWENDISEPTASYIKLLSKIFDVSYESLLDID